MKLRPSHLPALALLSCLAGGLMASPLLLAPPETTGIAPGVPENLPAGADAGPIARWTGPRPEAGQEILRAPLFLEARILPEPFEYKPPEPELPQPDLLPPEDMIDPLAGAVMEVPPLPDGMVPAPEPAAEPVPPPLALPDVTLLGTYIHQSHGMARALLAANGQDAEEVWVDKGGTFGGWVLTIVSPDAVRLEAGDQEVTLELIEEE